MYSYYPYSGYPWTFDGGDDSQPYPDNEQAPSPDYGPAAYPYYGTVPPSAQQSWPSPVPYAIFVVPPQAPPTEENPVTLIFRNGRAPEQIHNYLLTRTTLTILDQPYHQIPLDQIDIPATVEKNREAGVDFRVPDSSR